MTDPRSTLANIAMFGASPAITATLEAARAAAKHTAPVLLIAEPGLEVTLLASQIHELSRRAGPLQRLHGAEIAGPSVHTSPAASPLSGLIALPLILETIRGAKGGTLLIEDIDALTDGGQAIIESLLFQPVADGTGSDVRVIASTSRDLRERVQRGQFRGVLLDRLLYAPIHIPALRAREQDVLILAERILGTHRLLQGRKALRISEPAREILRSHPWTGNLAELERVLVRAAFDATDGTIKGSHVVRAIDEPGEVFRGLDQRWEGVPGLSLTEATAGRPIMPLEKAFGGEPAGGHRTALSDALKRLPDVAQQLTDQKSITRAAVATFTSYRDYTVLRELGRVGQLDIKEAGAVLDMDGPTTRRHMSRLVRAGKVLLRENVGRPTWSLPAQP